MMVSDTKKATKAQNHIRVLAGSLVDHNTLHRTNLRVIGCITAVPSTLSLPIKLTVSLASAAI